MKEVALLILGGLLGPLFSAWGNVVKRWFDGHFPANAIQEDLEVHREPNAEEFLRGIGQDPYWDRADWKPERFRLQYEKNGYQQLIHRFRDKTSSKYYERRYFWVPPGDPVPYFLVVKRFRSTQLQKPPKWEE